MGVTEKEGAAPWNINKPARDDAQAIGFNRFALGFAVETVFNQDEARSEEKSKI